MGVENAVLPGTSRLSFFLSFARARVGVAPATASVSVSLCLCASYQVLEFLPAKNSSFNRNSKGARNVSDGVLLPRSEGDSDAGDISASSGTPADSELEEGYSGGGGSPFGPFVLHSRSTGTGSA